MDFIEGFTIQGQQGWSGPHGPLSTLPARTETDDIPRGFPRVYADPGTKATWRAVRTWNNLFHLWIDLCQGHRFRHFASAHC